MTTTELIKLLKKYEHGGAIGRPREVMFEISDKIICTDGIEVIGTGDGLLTELFLSLPEAESLLEAHDKRTETHSCDCVSRQDAIDALKDAKNHAFNSFYDGLIKARKIIAKLPSVQPDRNTGKWARISIDKYIQHAQAWYRCSECGGEFIGQFNYCGNCGAKMVGGEQDDIRQSVD